MGQLIYSRLEVASIQVIEVTGVNKSFFDCQLYLCEKAESAKSIDPNVCERIYIVTVGADEGVEVKAAASKNHKKYRKVGQSLESESAKKWAGFNFLNFLVDVDVVTIVSIVVVAVEREMRSYLSIVVDGRMCYHRSIGISLFEIPVIKVLEYLNEAMAVPIHPNNIGLAELSKNFHDRDETIGDFPSIVNCQQQPKPNRKSLYDIHDDSDSDDVVQG